MTWRELRDELPWVDYSHRQIFEEAVEVLVECLRLRLFFAKRVKEFKAQGKMEAEAYLTDDGTQKHPLFTMKMAHGTTLRRALAELGATPQSQSRMIATIQERADPAGESVTNYFDS